MKWIRHSAIALLCTLMFSGCVAMGPMENADNVRCELGTLMADLDVPLPDAVKATSQAIDQIGFTEKVVAEDAMNAVISAKTAKSEKITFRLARVTETSSNIKIRIGKMGDRRRSLMVLEQIQEAMQ